MDLKQKIKNLPEEPGVYLMKDTSSNIIYVGKAKNLKRRVSQYFQKSKNHAPKIKNMIPRIYDFDIVVTDTELEAFLTECKLIKEFKPVYNSQMKNEKNYRYIKLSLSEEFPRIFISTEVSDDGSQYFGPYTSVYLVEQAVEFIKEYFQIRKCTTASFGKRLSGCMNHELKLCLGVCCNGGTYEEYKDCIKRIISFLEGYDKKPVIDLEQKMNAAAQRLDFEKAARYREYINGVRHVLYKQGLIYSSQRGRNVICVENMDNMSVKVFFIKGNKMMSMETITLADRQVGDISELLKKSLLAHFRNTNIKSSGRIGQQEMDEVQIIYSYLKKNKEKIYCFWIPQNWIESNSCKLGNAIAKIADKIITG
ncbi:MAG: UvrB/UvrC motif-containing protein [Clostridia bacterium]|nr:UvrB/UvrC motif-containing protein [Clostridia bacterium]